MSSPLKGSVWGRLGTKVTAVEFLGNIGGPGMSMVAGLCSLLSITGIDLDVAKQFQSILKSQGMDFKLETKVTGAIKQADGTIKVQLDKGGVASEIETGSSLFLCSCMSIDPDARRCPGECWPSPVPGEPRP